jgi:gluconate 2-dehydrogenase gamma chain
MDATRRQFLQASGGTLGLAWLASSWPQVAAAVEHAHAMAADTADRSRFLKLTPAQARDLEAIAAQIVPSGDTPGAREAGVVYFIDHLYASADAARAQEFASGLAHFQAACRKHHPEVAQFADLSEDEQLRQLKHVERSPFFGQMRFLTVCGLLALPSYGGNAQKLGWKLVGFDDQHAWQPPFGHYDAGYAGFVPYTKEPRS